MKPISKAIILAGGNGSRLRPLTNDKPKQMVEVLGKPLIDYVLASLPKQIEKLCVVYGQHYGEMLKKYMGKQYRGRSVDYRYQPEPNGTGDALMLAEDFVEPDESVLVIFADDVTSCNDLDKAIRYPWAMLGHEVEKTESFGVLRHENHKLLELVEKPATKDAPSKLASTGVMVVGHDFFRYASKERAGKDQEFRHVEMIAQCLRAGIHFEVVYQRVWVSVATPKDIEKLEAYLQAQ